MEERANSSLSKNVVVEAFDEQIARAHVKKKIMQTARVVDVNLLKQGKKGFFGRGKKPNHYEFQVFQPAVVEIIYKESENPCCVARVS